MNKRLSLLDKVNLYTVILSDARLSATSKVIAGWLLFNHHNTITGICTPSNRMVGRALGIRPENVSRNIRKLVKLEYLFVRRRFGTSNSYEFNWSKGGKEALREIRRAVKGAEAQVEDMTTTSRPNDGNVKTPCLNRHDSNDGNVNLTLESKTGTKDGSLTLSGESEASVLCNHGKVVDRPYYIEPTVDTSLEGVLTRFSSIYPLVIPENRLPAVRSALRRALTVANAEVILDGAMHYAMECTGREPNYIADSVNWLNGHRWSSKRKTKAALVVLGPDGKAVNIDPPRPMSRSQEILQWKPSRKNPFSLQ
jgi:hypothetical protein